jgi:Fe-S-cluster-containing dehydrogenase component
MTMDRRHALKVLAAGGAAVGGAAVPAPLHARPRREAPADAVGMLYDATLCVGCQACMVACKEANGLPSEGSDPRWDTPVNLTGKTKTVIKLYEEDGASSFMKAQCLHCIDPACASACMLGAYRKREFGIVTWDKDKCVGCRYCQIACPYNVPRFEWDRAAPKMVKCEMCAHRVVEGLEPACTEVCPREAVIFGSYTEMLTEARRRIAQDPDRYQPTVYGEKEGGGTQVLYLAGADVSYQDLGLPDLGEQPVPHMPESVQHFIYKGFVAPVALYAGLAAAMWRNRRLTEDAAADHEEV